MKPNIKKNGLYLIVILILFFCFNFIYPVRAAKVTSYKDIISTHDISTAANHTISFTTPSGVGAGQSMSFTFATGFNVGSVDHTDIDLEDDSVDLDLAAVAAGATWGASFTGNILTISSGTGTIAAGSAVTIEIGTHASHQTNGNQQVTNPGSSGSYLIELGGTFGDSGRLAVAVVDADAINVGATVSGGGPGPGPGDTTPPVISNVRVINITTDSATVLWDTDEAANSFVDYGLTDSYEIGTEANASAFVTSHSIDLSGLEPATIYYFQVRSFDSSGNEATSSGHSFTTLEEEIEEGFLYLRALPEKRLPSTGNNSTILRVRMFEAGTDDLVLDETVTTTDNGYNNDISLSGLDLPADYDFLIKGYSHLQHRKNTITVTGEAELVDFSEGGTVFEKAGDVNGDDGDNFVNGLDLSVLANNIYTDDYKSDLNQDDLVNGLEFAIAVTNLWVWGDF